MSLSPRESARFIAENADHVKINAKAIPELAEIFYESLRGGKFGDTWDEISLHPKGSDAFAANWIFVLDSLNFSFWTDREPKYMVDYKSELHTGYPALCSVINRAIDDARRVKLLTDNLAEGLSQNSQSKTYSCASQSFDVGATMEVAFWRQGVIGFATIPGFMTIGAVIKTFASARSEIMRLVPIDTHSVMCGQTHWGGRMRVSRKGDSNIPFSLLKSSNGINMVDPKVLVNLTRSDLESIFKSASSSPIPLLDERLEILHTNGRILLEQFGGCFTNCIKACDGSAVKLIQLVCEKFPSFRDEATYKGQKVLLYKRVQILVADLWLAFRGESYGHFTDIDTLTAFADYRVPQVLNFFKVLEYDKELMAKLKNSVHQTCLSEKKHNELIESKSPLEVEIRGCCLQAVELLNEKTRKLLSDRGNTGVVCNSVIADNFLWLYRRKFAKEVEEAVPMHRTRCIFY
ncbi:hypothetical protein ACTXT7_005902 [Hymenolepis weldensis]